jgi:hypothetical protein
MPKFIKLVSLKEALNALALTALDAENTQDAYMLRQAAQSLTSDDILTISVGDDGEPVHCNRGTYQVEVVRHAPIVRMIRVYSTGVAFEEIGCLTVYADLTRTDLTGGAPHYLIEESDEQVFF